MSQRKVNVTIDPMGNVTIDAEGFKGQGCVDKTMPIEQVFQQTGRQSRRTYKDSYTESEGVAQNQEVSW